MVMQKVVIDTDIVIDFTRKASPILRILFEKAAQKEIRLFFPASVIAELMSGRETKAEVKFKNLSLLIKKIAFVALDYELSVAAGFLIRDIKNLKLGDAIVAATALSLNAKLATRNKKDFEGIKDLKFFKLHY